MFKFKILKSHLVTFEMRKCGERIAPTRGNGIFSFDNKISSKSEWKRHVVPSFSLSLSPLLCKGKNYFGCPHSSSIQFPNKTLSVNSLHIYSNLLIYYFIFPTYYKRVLWTKRVKKKIFRKFSGKVAIMCVFFTM